MQLSPVILVALVSSIVAAGCAPAPIAAKVGSAAQKSWSVAAMVPAATPSQFGADTAVADGGSADGKSITVNMLPPIEPGFRKFELLTVQHHWTAADIFSYTAVLTAFYTPIGYLPLNYVPPTYVAGVIFPPPGGMPVPMEVATTTLNPKGDYPQTKAVFTNLKQGTMYRVSVLAMGNVGGDAATTHLNATMPAFAWYDFTATQDVQDSLAASIAITFDPVPFNGSAATTVIAPLDGGYRNADDHETGSAE